MKYRFVAFLTIITELPDITLQLVGITRTWSSNSKWVKHAHKTVEIYYIVRSVRHVRVLPRPKFWVVVFFEKFITKKSTHHNLIPRV
jgi:hypothetical protein